MNVNKYTASGSTHSSGIGATFVVKCVEMETSKPDAHAENAIQSAI